MEEQIRRYSTEQSTLEEQIRDLMLKIKQDHDQHVVTLNTSKLESINLLRKLLGDLYHGLKLLKEHLYFIYFSNFSRVCLEGRQLFGKDSFRLVQTSTSCSYTSRYCFCLVKTIIR